MRIGFIGSHHGMTPAQMQVLHSMLTGHKGAALHHGDCVGADAQAHEVACSLGRDVTIHPPVNGTHRAWETHAIPALRDLTSVVARTSCGRRT